MRKSNTKLLWLLPISISLFAFGNSLMTGSVSANVSSQFMTILGTFFQWLLNTDKNTAHLLIRKCAHFTEYFFLGATFQFAYLKNKAEYNTRQSSYLFIILFLIPIIDESIQYFVPGRVASFVDIIIDSSGIICGVLIIYFINHLIQKKRLIAITKVMDQNKQN